MVNIIIQDYPINYTQFNQSISSFFRDCYCYISTMNDLERFYQGYSISCPSSIKRVIFNPPATIVFWDDNTKTVIKCGEHETFDKEKGLAMAIAKHTYGNTGSYYKIFRKFCHVDEKNAPKLSNNVDFE